MTHSDNSMTIDDAVEARRNKRREYSRVRYATDEEFRMRKKLQAKTRYSKNPDRARELMRADPVAYKRRQMFQSAKQRARMYGWPFAITLDDIPAPEECPALGIKLNWASSGKPTDASPSLDRTNGDLGYVQGNIAVISFLANSMKQNASAEQIARLAKYVKDALTCSK